MTEEEFDLANIKAAKIQKYSFLFTMTVFLLTSYYVGLFLPVGGFILSIFISLFMGLVFAALFTGSQILAQTNLHWMFAVSLSLIGGVFPTALASYLSDEIPKENRYLVKFVILINCASLIISIGVGALLLFRSEVERIAKIVRFSTPNKKSVLNIQDSETSQN